MKRYYILTLLLLVAGSAISQQQITDRVIIPLYTQNQQGIAESPVIMVHKGEVFNIEANFIAPAKKTLFGKILKGAGAAAVAYQSEQLIQRSIGKGNEKDVVQKTNVNKNNWLLPLGAAVAVAADKLLPKASVQTAISYQLYNNKNILVSSVQVPVTNTKKPFVISDRVIENGYLKVRFINNRQKPVTNGNINITVAQPAPEENEEEKIYAKAETVIPQNLRQPLPVTATPQTLTAPKQEITLTLNYTETTTKTFKVVNGVLVSSTATTTVTQSAPEVVEAPVQKPKTVGVMLKDAEDTSYYDLGAVVVITFTSSDNLPPDGYIFPIGGGGGGIASEVTVPSTPGLLPTPPPPIPKGVILPPPIARIDCITAPAKGNSTNSDYLKNIANSFFNDLMSGMNVSFSTEAPKTGSYTHIATDGPRIDEYTDGLGHYASGQYRDNTVYISPAIFNQGLNAIIGVIGHELIHALVGQKYANLGMSSTAQDYVAYLFEAKIWYMLDYNSQGDQSTTEAKNRLPSLSDTDIKAVNEFLENNNMPATPLPPCE